MTLIVVALDDFTLYHQVPSTDDTREWARFMLESGERTRARMRKEEGVLHKHLSDLMTYGHTKIPV